MFGQSLTVAGGASATVSAAPDFATTAVGDPWDFSQATDYLYMFSSGWQSGPSVASGHLTGVASTNPGLQLQFEGTAGALNIVGRNGVRFPIDPAAYNRVSFKMARGNTNCDTIEATWFQDILRTASTIGAKLAYRCGFDSAVGTWTNQDLVANQSNAGAHIYKLDLDSTTVRSYGQAWTAATVRGFSLRVGESIAGSSVDVDWVRLSRRGSATTTLAWSGFGGAVTLTATNGTDTIQIFPDDGTSASTFSDNRSFTWDYGFLPAGTWTITASRGSTSRGATLTILPQPVISIAAPNPTNGEDFAQSVIGDAWDLTNSEDISRYGFTDQVSDVTFSAAGLHATAAGLDNKIGLLYGIKRPSVPTIDASKYRHLTFTLEYDEKGHKWDGGLDYQNRFGIARVLWQRADGLDATSQDIIVLDAGPETFSMDLGDFQTTGDCATCQLEALGSIGYWQNQVWMLRLDPMEPCDYYGCSTRPAFRYANVKLTADERPDARGVFVIRWNAADAPSGSTLSIYREARSNTYATPNTSSRQLIATVSPSAGQYSWYAANVPTGRYFIHFVLKNASGATLATRISEAPVAITTQVVDTDLDGMSDAWETQFGLNPASAAGNDGPNGDPDGDGVTNLAEFLAGSHPTNVAAYTRYFAEGAANYFFDCYFALMNPGSTPANVLLRFLKDDGTKVTQYISVPAMSRRTVVAKDVVGLAPVSGFSTVIETDALIVADRTMTWQASGYGSHAETAIVAPAQTWYLAEGATHSGFDLYYLLQNPNSSGVTAEIRYLRAAGLPVITRQYYLAPNSRTTILVNNQASELAAADVSGVVRSLDPNLPIIVERAMYLTRNGEFYGSGHDSAGVTSPSTDWFLAEGSTGDFFSMFILIANPGESGAAVTATYLLRNGTTVTKDYWVAANSRRTIFVNFEDPLLRYADMSTILTSTNGVPIIVERSMWWPTQDPSQWREAHNSPGTTTTGTLWAVADGEQGGSRNTQTYILVANTSPFTGRARVTLVFDDGTTRAMDITIYGNSRLTVAAGDPAGFGPYTNGRKFGATVESLDVGGQTAQIVVERAMYSDADGVWWSAGTDVVATKIR